MKQFLFFMLCLLPGYLSAQSYTSYFTGNTADTVTNPTGGICLMGGATEDDNAMKWFLQQANGGDILVLRTSGSNGYNTYLYSQLGIPVHSVETIVCNNATASADAYVLQKIQQAEGIWFAGGDQWTYVSYWRNTAVDSLINLGIQQRNIVVGGTSAGMAIQGKYYFSAQNGTVTSTAALANPYNSLLTVDSTTFIKNNFLTETITDTHFDNPDRKGRLLTFMARMWMDYGVEGRAIACDEYTAVCVDTNGLARVYGDFPANDDNAYFIQTNCELVNGTPEICTSGLPLTWNHSGAAVKVYRVKGTATGSNTFQLNNWLVGSGGSWLQWSANTGNFVETTSSSINCSPLAIATPAVETGISIYPNPATQQVAIDFLEQKHVVEINLLDGTGRTIQSLKQQDVHEVVLNTSQIKPGIYFIKVRIGMEKVHYQKLEIN